MSKIDGEHLEVLGKKAASLWADGRAETLNEAVTSVVKTAGLLPEQVRRVIEFANTAAFLGEFKKEGAQHKVVDFGPGGPASPSVVIKDLNHVGEHFIEKGASDYSLPPSSPDTEKTASVWGDQALASMFVAGEDKSYPEVNPLGDAIDLRDKLGAAYQQTTSMLNDLEAAYADLHDRLFHEVKQASLSGHHLSEVVRIWADSAPSEEHVKIAFTGIMNRLVDNGVFADHAALVDSLEKHASVGVVNQQHPLVDCFKQYCDVLTKLSEVRAAQQELGEGHAQLTKFVKEGWPKPTPFLRGQGVLGKAKHLHEEASQLAGRGGHAIGKVLFGPGPTPDLPKASDGARHLGNAGYYGVKAVLPALVMNEGYRRFLKHNPTFHTVADQVMGMIPGTQQYQERDFEYALRNQGYPPGSGGFP